MNNMFYYGIVENRQDPLQLGRCQVRIAGVHTHDKSLLPTADLPWSTPVSPITSSAMNGIGHAPLGPVEGTTVLITFADGERKQQPIMFGSIGGISSAPAPIEDNLTGETDPQQVVRTSQIRLETIDEPTSGTQLTFVDYETGNTDLTSSLLPDMRVIGFNLPDNTRIVSIDSNNQITINNTVTEYRRNILRFEPAPRNIQALQDSISFQASEIPTNVPSVGNTVAARPANNAVNSEIPVLPPEGSVANTSAATEGIRALLAACDAVGLTTKEQKCALLGIIGGESAWIPKEESHNYTSVNRIRQIYSFLSQEEAERYSSAPSKGISKFDFFSVMYGPTKRGANFLGNRTNADGGRFFGRGFIQLTGRSNYERYQRLGEEAGLNIDIVNNPDSLNTDINVSAMVAALYLKDRVPSSVSPSSHPNYFYAAKDAVGVNSRDIAARKFSYYEYFYGQGTGGSQRSAEPPQAEPLTTEERDTARDVTYYNEVMTRVNAAEASETVNIDPATQEEIDRITQRARDFREQAVRRGVPESSFTFDREGNLPAGVTIPEGLEIPTDITISNWINEPDIDYINFVPNNSAAALVRGSGNTGFRDPNNKYPLDDYINEPDTNRLARGIIEGTIIETKDANRKTGLKKPFGGTWQQPEVPFGAQYPYNRVFESESGHVQEFDDTPGQERINTYHRSGTYTEVDANGTQVNYIVGDNYVMMERNGNIHIAGECNVTTEGPVNIMVQSDANINVSQNAKIEVGNNIDLNVHNDINMVAGGHMRVSVAGDYSVTAANIFNYTAGNMKSQADSGMHLQSGDLMYVSSKAGLQLHDAERVNIESGGTVDLLSASEMNLDYSQGNFGDGATGAGIADTIGSGLETASRQNDDGDPDWTFTAPEIGQPINRFQPNLLSPERDFELLSSHETPEEWDTPEGRFQSNEYRLDTQNPQYSETVTAEAAPPATGGSTRQIPVNCDIIDGETTFGNDFRLSENFTLGMLIDGGVNGRHRLVDQTLSDGGASRVYTVQEIVCNLASLAQNVLEPALEFLPGGIDGYRNLWQINSGYRLRGVVARESARSQHPKGMAVDIGIYGDGTYDKFEKHFQAVQAIERACPYDQLILEYRNPTSCWIHCSYAGDASRRMAFTMVNDSTYRRDENGVPSGFYLLDNIPPKN